MSVKNKRKVKKRKIFAKGKCEDLYSLTKMITGIITGIILGITKIVGLLGFLIGCLIIIMFYFIGRYVFNLKNEKPIKLLLWYGTFSFFFLMIVTWALVLNFTTELSYP